MKILPSRGKKGSSNTSSRPTPRSAEKKKPVSGRSLNVVATTSSSGGKGNGKGGGRGRDASPQRDDIEDEEVWDLPVKKEGRQVHTYQEDTTNFMHLNFASSQVKGSIDFNFIISTFCSIMMDCVELHIINSVASASNSIFLNLSLKCSPSSLSLLYYQ